jgi:hypothetical protein
MSSAESDGNEFHAVEPEGRDLGIRLAGPAHPGSSGRLEDGFERRDETSG